MKRISMLLMVLLISASLIGCQGCSFFGPVQPGQTQEQKVVDDLQKSIVVIHDNLYLPTMTILGARLNSGHVTPAQETRIQTLSEKYQQAKAGADVIIREWSAHPEAENKAKLTDKLTEMTATISELNRTP